MAFISYKIWAVFVIVLCYLLVYDILMFNLWTDLALLLFLTLVLPLFFNYSLMVKLGKARPASDASIRVLSYNIFLRPALWMIKNNADDYKNQRLRVFIDDWLDRWDIISLQEMFSLLTFRQRMLLKAAAAKGFTHAAVSGSAPYFFCDSHFTLLKAPFLDPGVIILSRYPMNYCDYFPFKHGHQIDGWVPKQVLYANIGLPHGATLHFFNSHLQATHLTDVDPTKSFVADMARAKQIQEYASFVQSKLYREDEALGPFSCLVTGDFNLDAKYSYEPGVSSLDYVRMMDIFKRTMPEFQVIDCLPTHPVTFGDYDVSVHGERVPKETVLTAVADRCSGLCIDFMLLIQPMNSDAAAVTLTEAGTEEFQIEPTADCPCTYLSDHYGISATLEFQALPL